MNEKAIAAVRSLMFWFKAMVIGGIALAAIGLIWGIIVGGIPGVATFVMILVGCASLGIGLRELIRAKRVLAKLEAEQGSKRSE